MKKALSFFLVVTILFMLVVPLLIRFLVKPIDSTGFLMLDFLIINPIFFSAMGHICGRNIKPMWWLPLLSAFMFVIGTWISFDMGNTDFFVYAGIYIVISYLVMLFTYLFTRKSNR